MLKVQIKQNAKAENHQFLNYNYSLKICFTELLWHIT